ncbi:MAG: glycosyl hydrolase [Prolixibacteraceae bacterium]|jgi:mannan endo-1,4-beta-mannosidase|nr:glycosyl hydrolase [Prolixibacteraceae bacterium]
MTKVSFHILLLLVLLAGCTEEPDEPKLPPLFKSSIPNDGDENVSLLSEVTVTFDEVVSLDDNHGITVNDEKANVEASFTKLMFDIELQYETTYHIEIPAGAVINTKNLPLEENIEFEFSTEKAPEVVTIKEKLVIKNPSSQAVNVYNFLKQNYGVKSISAAMSNVAWNVNEAEWVNKHAGKYPAMATFDYIHLPYSPANWIDYSNITVAKEWWNENGIISAGWHWIVPASEGSSEYTYKPDETTFKTKNVMIEGTWEHEVALADLTKMAGYLKLLRDENIPVIWRPFHEAAGNIYEYNGGQAWFWWGTGGAETYRALWKYMFDYFEEQGLNNLIWVWTTQTKDDDFYPGDEYVDIIGRDIYNNGSASDIAGQFEQIQATYPDRIVTLSEFGSVARFSTQWEEGALWSYFMPWYHYERTSQINSEAFDETDHMHANIEWWINALSHEAVITRDEMPSLK